jgi:hypothetical protein
MARLKIKRGKKFVEAGATVKCMDHSICFSIGFFTLLLVQSILSPKLIACPPSNFTDNCRVGVPVSSLCNQALATPGLCQLSCARMGGTCCIT